MYRWIWNNKLNCYCAEHNPTIRADRNGNVFGGGSTSIQSPSPAPAPTTAESIDAYIKGLPQMYQAQLDWSPKLAEQDVGLYEQYLPQLTALTQGLQAQYAPQEAAQQWELQQQYAPLLAQQQQELQQQYQPEAYAAKQLLGGQMTPEYLSGQGAFNVATDPTMQAMNNMVTPEWMTGYSAQEAPGMQAARERLQQQARGAWADRGLAQSGMSAEDETKMLSEFELPYALQQEQLTQQVNAQRQALGAQLGTSGLQSQQNAWQNYYNQLNQRQNTALQMAGMYAAPSQSSVTTPQTSIPNYSTSGYNVMSGYSYPQVANNMVQGYGNYTNAYSSLYGTNAASAGQNSSNLFGLGGSALGAAGMLGAGMMIASSRRYKNNIKLWA